MVPDIARQELLGQGRSKAESLDQCDDTCFVVMIIISRCGPMFLY